MTKADKRRAAALLEEHASHLCSLTADLNGRFEHPEDEDDYVELRRLATLLRKEAQSRWVQTTHINHGRRCH